MTIKHATSGSPTGQLMRYLVTTRFLVALFSIAMVSVLMGCGVSTDVQNPPPPPNASSLSIAFQTAPPASVIYTSVAPLTAVVKNDPSSSGVDWSVSCSSPGNCGSVNPQHSASGTAVNFTPPANLSSNSQPVTIEAFATADHTKNVLASITVTAFGSFLQKGNYIVHTSGIDPVGDPYQRVGVIAIDGNGNVSAGEETVNFQSPNGLTSVTDTITGGTYFIGQDGRGTITVTTADANLGNQGVEVYALVALSSSHALVTKMDFLGNSQGLSSNESSVGTLDLQTGMDAPTGGYAFVAGGTDVNLSGIGLGGVLNITPGSVSAAGSVFDFAANDGSGVITPSSSVSGTVSPQDAFGTFQVNIDTDFGSLQFSAYEIDVTHVFLIETDAAFGFTSGIAIGQGAATGTFTTPGSFHGAYAFGTTGTDGSAIVNSLAAAGKFTAGGGNGILSAGFIDETQRGLQIEFSDKFTGTFTVDPGGSGRVDTNSSFVFGDPNNGTGPELVFYLTGNGNPILVLDADIEPALAGGGEFGFGVGTGIAYPITAGATFTGSYGFSLTQNLPPFEFDGTGDITASAQTVSGVSDANIGFVPTLADQGTNVSDGFGTTNIAGRLTGTLSTPLTSSLGLANVSVAYYLIDSNHGFVVENDGDAFSGVNPGDLSFGFFATRTPVCQGCP